MLPGSQGDPPRPPVCGPAPEASSSHAPGGSWLARKLRCSLSRKSKRAAAAAAAAACPSLEVSRSLSNCSESPPIKPAHSRLVTTSHQTVAMLGVSSKEVFQVRDNPVGSPTAADALDGAATAASCATSATLDSAASQSSLFRMESKLEVLRDPRAESRALVAALLATAKAQPPQLFADRYLIKSDVRRDGAAVVAPARGAGSAVRLFSIRFFLVAHDYHVERRSYADPLLRQALPRLVHDGGCGRAVRAASGYEFPPHLIVERGVPLTQWLQTRRSERAVLRMATGVLHVLSALHDAGRVHRNVHPGHVLHIVHTDRWRLQGLGSVATIGSQPLAVGESAYLAPEAVRAQAVGDDLPACASLDMWALGVIVYEAVTDSPALSRYGGYEEAKNCARSVQPYPWERSDGTAAAAWAGSRCGAVFSRCLARDPAERPAAPALLRALRSFAGDCVED